MTKSTAEKIKIMQQTMNLWTAMHNQDLQDFISAISNNADFNIAISDEGITPLHYISKHITNIDFLTALLKANVNLSPTDLKGKTPLHLAIEFFNTSVGMSLINAGCDINARDIYSKTPLIYCAEHGNTEIENLLKQHNADESIADIDGRTCSKIKENFRAMGSAAFTYVTCDSQLMNPSSNSLVAPNEYIQK